MRPQGGGNTDGPKAKAAPPKNPHTGERPIPVKAPPAAVYVQVIGGKSPCCASTVVPRWTGTRAYVSPVSEGILGPKAARTPTSPLQPAVVTPVRKLSGLPCSRWPEARSRLDCVSAISDVDKGAQWFPFLGLLSSSRRACSRVRGLRMKAYRPWLTWMPTLSSRRTTSRRVHGETPPFVLRFPRQPEPGEPLPLVRRSTSPWTTSASICVWGPALVLVARSSTRSCPPSRRQRSSAIEKERANLEPKLRWLNATQQLCAGTVGKCGRWWTDSSQTP